MEDIFEEIQDVFYDVTTEDENGCWIFPNLFRDGYGRFHVHVHSAYGLSGEAMEWLKMFASHSISAHRVSFVVFGGVVTEEKPFVLHSCHNPSCCNPDHLHAGSQKENVREAFDSNRRLRKGQQPSYKRGRWARDDIKRRILNGESFRSIAKLHDCYLYSIHCHARTLEKQGHILPQRQPK